MFDVHNAIDESEPHAALVDRYFDCIRHVHVNELDGRHCGTGALRFQAGLRGAGGAAATRAGFRSKLSISPPARSASPANRCATWNRQIAKLPSMSHYVVTGGAGFIGSAIVRALLREGARKIVVIDNLLTGHESNLEEVRGADRFPAGRHPQLRGDRAAHPRRGGGVSRSRHPFRAALHRRSGSLARGQHRWHVQRAAGGARGRRRPGGLCGVLLGVRRYRGAAQSGDHGAAAEIALRAAEAGGRILLHGIRGRLRPGNRVAALFQRLRPAAGPLQPLFRRAVAVHESGAGAPRRRRFSATANNRATSPMWRTWPS